VGQGVGWGSWGSLPDPANPNPGPVCEKSRSLARARWTWTCWLLDPASVIPFPFAAIRHLPPLHVGSL
jgi:hypothetical protein